MIQCEPQGGPYSIRDRRGHRADVLLVDCLRLTKGELAKGKVRIRHGIENAVALHFAFSCVSHWRDPIMKGRRPQALGIGGTLPSPGLEWRRPTRLDFA